MTAVQRDLVRRNLDAAARARTKGTRGARLDPSLNRVEWLSHPYPSQPQRVFSAHETENGAGSLALDNH